MKLIAFVSPLFSLFNGSSPVGLECVFQFLFFRVVGVSFFVALSIFSFVIFLLMFPQPLLAFLF